MLEEPSGLFDSLPLPGWQFLELGGLHLEDRDKIVEGEMHLLAPHVDAGWQVLRFAFQHRQWVLDVVVEVRGCLRDCLRPRRLLPVFQQSAESLERLIIPQ